MATNKELVEMARARLREAIHEEPVSFHEFHTDAVEFVQQLDSEPLQCRNLMHAWEAVPMLRDLNRGLFAGASVRMLVCARCESVRLDFLTRRGNVFHRKYLYAEGYMFPHKKTAGAIPRDLLKAEQMRREKHGTTFGPSIPVKPGMQQKINEFMREVLG